MRRLSLWLAAVLAVGGMGVAGAAPAHAEVCVSATVSVLFEPVYTNSHCEPLLDDFITECVSPQAVLAGTGVEARICFPTPV
jgi:hypothetical protein